MAFITFISDMGYRDHYVASMKGMIYSIHPSCMIIDIAHKVEAFNLSQAAYTIRSTYKNFPKGTIHLIAVGTSSMNSIRFIIAKIDSHYFVAPDNGILSLIIDKDPELVIELEKKEEDTFPEKNILAKAAAQLALGEDISKLGNKITTIEKKLFRQPRQTENQLIGAVIYIDEYGNLITNIEYALFEKLKQNKKFQLKIGRETIHSIHTYYNQVEPGDCIALFNSNHLLEIAIYKGNAMQLLGIQFDHPITISFY